jgi:cyclic pyranopterin phosphate synthase
MVQSSTLPKGNALETARVAAIMAAKNTPIIIPLCHPLLLSGVTCEFDCDASQGTVHVKTTVRCTGKTGVEMEALTAASAALLTIYDMT